ncbi:uncharacterized protein LOC124922167 isoform X2 [Impatiens glandulifera]|uniref:uncharacterized protein LOC124922167 isoform X2 n=1 Tax=Impatiens glandulifera TaxID=253017 RepID=UPI001FB15796|nr:uncharacterized protein LOC124922167 isoform X2 [Impatiens glandulifera]
MVFFKGILVFLLPTFLLLSASLFSFANAHFEGENEYGVISWGAKRSVLGFNNNGGNVQNKSMILAADRTRRKDPLNKFNYYTGGWNISEVHYFSSVGFSAAPLFVIAGIWFVGFGCFLLLFCACCCCCWRTNYGYSQTAYAASLIFLLLFSLAAIIGCVILYTGQGKFHDSTSNTLGYVLNQAGFTVDNLRNVSNYLASAKKVGVNQVVLPSDVQNNIDDANAKIVFAANTLQSVTVKNKDNIDKVLGEVRLALVIVAAVMLLVALLGFFCSVLGLQFFVYCLVIIGWILVAVTFILGGVFLLLHNVVGDTCIAMDEWVKNPTAHTALDDILPCVDKATAQQTLTQSKDVTSALVSIVNGIIANVSNVNVPNNLKPLYYNQNGPLVPFLCNPYNSDDGSNRACAIGEVNLNNATQVWKNYVCEVSNDVCTTVGRLTPSMYNEMTSAVNVSYGLYHYGPFLIGLLDCSFVRETFTVISKDHCPDLTRYSQWVYAGLAVVAGSVMLSLVFWVLYSRERRHRKYTKLVDSSSVHSSFGDKRIR